VLTLKELVNRCLNKDASAWDEFVFRFQGIVEKSIRARFSRHNFKYTNEDVKDLTQGIFLDIWEHNKLESVREEDKIIGWVVIVAQNAAIDFIRSQARFSRYEPLFHNSDGDSPDIADTLPSLAPGPLEEAMQSDLTSCLDGLIELLPPKEKLILKLNIQHNMTHKEISGLMKISINTVSSILRRTVLRLKEALRKKGYADI